MSPDTGRCADGSIAACDRWLDLVECWSALLSRRRPERGVLTSTGDLEEAIPAHIAGTNAHPEPFRRAKTADGILASIARSCQRTCNSHH